MENKKREKKIKKKENSKAQTNLCVLCNTHTHFQKKRYDFSFLFFARLINIRTEQLPWEIGISPRQRVRVVKETDLKSVGLARTGSNPVVVVYYSLFAPFFFLTLLLLYFWGEYLMKKGKERPHHYLNFFYFTTPTTPFFFLVTIF